VVTCDANTPSSFISISKAILQGVKKPYMCSQVVLSLLQSNLKKNKRQISKLTIQNQFYKFTKK
jgi:hypothetical protein